MHYARITERLSNKGSHKWAVHIRAREMKAAGEDIIELTIGEPDIPTPADMIDEAARSMRAGRTRYTSGRGEPSILAALSEKYSKRTGRTISKQQILCFPGTQSALAIAMLGLAEDGDEVITTNPCYATYEGVIKATGATPVYVPVSEANGFRLQAEDLEKVITPRSRVLLLNSPHNPTGAMLSRKEIVAIGEVCRK
ncbi:MAG: aminotransferase class I/II-fold pyridoxal phosphate-dependent enzyme, partial [Brucellaceae bacterium]|nr:aminotransferase class I/II-fold pyridoxal phosphate-dependent enzyme [Brucellaceae bacterium]